MEIKCNQALGRDFSLDDLLGAQGFDAVVLAIGAHESRTLGIPGEDKKGVISGIDFLREVAAEPCVKATGHADAKGNCPT